jgi:starvation-inducible DNA-binding protein
MAKSPSKPRSKDPKEPAAAPAPAPSLDPLPFATRNDLAPGVRTGIVAELAPRLAEAIDLALQAKQAHWNVRGANFAGLHALFDTLAGEAHEHADELAERIVQLGGAAEGTLAAVAARTKLPAYPLTLFREEDHVNALADACARFGRGVRAGIDACTRLGDADSADLLTGISRASDKMLWMLEAHAQR